MALFDNKWPTSKLVAIQFFALVEQKKSIRKRQQHNLPLWPELSNIVQKMSSISTAFLQIVSSLNSFCSLKAIYLFFARPYVLIKALCLLDIFKFYVYSFWQIFHALCLFFLPTFPGPTFNPCPLSSI